MAAKAPARTFRKLTSVPFLPPTLQVAEIIKKKCNTSPNPDTEWLQAQARRYLPQAPHGRTAPCEGDDTLKIIAHWSRLIERTNTNGAPDVGRAFA